MTCMGDREIWPLPRRLSDNPNDWHYVNNLFCRVFFIYLSTCGEKNTVALDISMDNSLWMQESQSFQHGTAHTGHLLLCQTRERN